MLFKHNLFYGLHFSPDTGGGGGAGAAGNAGGDEGGDEGGNSDGQDGGSDEDGEELSGLKTALEKERADRKAAQRDIRALKKQIADLEKSGNGEGDEKSLDDAIKRAEDAETRLREANARMAITAAATKAGASNVEVVLTYVMSKAELDDDGNPLDVDDLIEDVKKEVPQLFTSYRVPSGDGGKKSVSKYEPSPGVARIAHAYEQNARAAKR